jgi:hypothetical protein
MPDAEKPCFEIVRVEYRVTMFDFEDQQVAEITPWITVRAEKRQMLVANLCVDGHELLPSGKMIIGAGETTDSLRAVRIIDPLTVNTPFSAGGYRMTLKLAGIDDKVVAHESLFDVPAERSATKN